MNGETISPTAPIPGQSDVPYEPRHAAPEIDVEVLGAEAKAADEYYQTQVLRQRLAEYALEHGPLGPDTTEARRVKFAVDQCRILGEAVEQQAIARNYANDKWAQISASFGLGVISFYEGRHRKPEDGRAGKHAAPEPAEPEVVAPPTVEDTPKKDEELEPLVAPPEPEQAEEAVAEEAPAKRRRGLKAAWYAAGAALTAYFANPEKGKRRQIVAVLGGYAAAATFAYLAGKANGQFSFNWHDLLPGSPPGHRPPEATQQFYDNLQPQDYHGEPYEWGAVADNAGPANANSQLLGMVEDARSRGAEVETWGNPASGYWGISYVEVPLTGGGSKAYYDTQHKLAILQYLSDQDSEVNMR